MLLGAYQNKFFYSFSLGIYNLVKLFTTCCGPERQKNKFRVVWEITDWESSDIWNMATLQLQIQGSERQSAMDLTTKMMPKKDCFSINL